MLRLPDMAVRILEEIVAASDARLIQVPVGELALLLNWAREQIERGTETRP